MSSVLSKRLDQVLLFFYFIFILGSTFSRAVSQTSLGGALIIFLIIAIRERYQPFVKLLKWFYLPVFLYLIWLLLASAMSNNPGFSLYTCRKEWLFAAVPIGIYVFQREKLKSLTFKILAIGIFIFSIYGIIEYFTNMDWLQFTNGAFVPTPIDQQIAGTFERTLTYAAYYGTVAVMLTAFALSANDSGSIKSMRILVSALFGFVATILTVSRGAFIASGFGLIILAFSFKKYVRWSIIGALAIFTLVSFSLPGQQEKFLKIYEVESKGSHEGSRHFIWKNSFEMIKQNPLFGVGNGNFMPEYRILAGETTPPEYIHGQAHNDLINTAAIGGIPCAIFFAAFWIAAFWYMGKGARNKKFTDETRAISFIALIGGLVYLMNSLTNSIFAAEETHGLIMIIFAIGLAPWYTSGKHITSNNHVNN